MRDLAVKLTVAALVGGLIVGGGLLHFARFESASSARSPYEPGRPAALP